jgi:hypothetical protein
MPPNLAGKQQQGEVMPNQHTVNAESVWKALKVLRAKHGFAYMLVVCLAHEVVGHLDDAVLRILEDKGLANGGEVHQHVLSAIRSMTRLSGSHWVLSKPATGKL